MAIKQRDLKGFPHCLPLPPPPPPFFISDAMSLSGFFRQSSPKILKRSSVS